MPSIFVSLYIHVLSNIYPNSFNVKEREEGNGSGMKTESVNDEEAGKVRKFI
jgi:hypothetical protein